MQLNRFRFINGVIMILQIKKVGISAVFAFVEAYVELVGSHVRHDLNASQV